MMGPNILHKTCLACLGQCSKMFNHQEVVLDKLKILEILYKTVPLVMESQDFNLPEWMCPSCLEDLLTSYKFQKQCLKSIQYLTKLSQESSFTQKIMHLKNEILSDEDDPGSYLAERKSLSPMETKPFEVIVMGNEKAKDEGLSINSEVISFEDQGNKQICSKLITNKKLSRRPQKRGKPSKIKHPRNAQKSDEFQTEEDKPNRDKQDDEKSMKLNKMPFGVKMEIEIDDNNDQEDITPKQTQHETTKSVTSNICHLDDPTSETPNLCNICGKSFKRLDYLKQHTKRHSNEKPYKCSLCEKSFICRSDCTNHKKRVHIGEKPYKCRFCDKKFSFQYDCLSHEKVHTGEKPYTCQQCSKTFRRISNLNKHVFIHKIEKAYKCRFCDKRFKHDSTVRSHEKTHTRIKPIKKGRKSENLHDKFVLMQNTQTA